MHLSSTNEQPMLLAAHLVISLNTDDCCNLLADINSHKACGETPAQVSATLLITS